jgi:protein-disulfide isomerase
LPLDSCRVQRTRALLGTAKTLIDLAVPVEDDRDHIRGPADAKVTLVEYGDFECHDCSQAERGTRHLASFGDLRYVWGDLPLTDVHPNAALSAEAADRQGAFWLMHDLLLQHLTGVAAGSPGALRRRPRARRFREDVRRHVAPPASRRLA